MTKVRAKATAEEQKIHRIAMFGQILCLLLALLLYAFDVGASIDLNLKDSALSSPKPIDTRIVILGIDEASLKALGPWPWPRSVMAQLVDTLSAGEPSAIGIDVLFSEPSADPIGDEALAHAIERAGNVVLPVSGHFKRVTKTTQSDALHAESVTLPLESLQKAAVLGHINVIPDEIDGVVRHVLSAIETEGVIYPSFAQRVYETAGSQNIVHSSQSRVIDFVGRPNEYGAISVSDVISGAVEPAFFKNAIVLIGPIASGIVDDYYTTPIDKQSQMTGIEIHANILQNYLESRFKAESLTLDLLFILLLFAIVFYAGRQMTPVLTALVLLASAAGFIFLTQEIYRRGTMVSLFYPLLGAILLYLFQLVMRNVENHYARKRITAIFGKYVAPEVVNEILRLGEDGLSLGGSKRDITALFVDVRGFTPLSEKTDPETLVKILNTYLNLTASAIHHHKGTLDKFIGDATMAVFNAPLDLPDHELYAIKAALEMREGAEALNADLFKSYGIHLDFGIGIYSGPSIIGNIGSASRMDYTAIGDTVNTAARLENKAKSGQILISQALYEKLKDQISGQPLGAIKLKGKENNMEVYNVLGLNQANPATGGTPHV